MNACHTMRLRPHTALLPLLLLMASACSTLQETAMSGDDVYDIPDRLVVAMAPAPRDTEAPPATDDYYDPAESARAESAQRGYYDLAYNDPYWYNYGRFGFGSSISSFGPGFGMGLSYGWPTSFGSMSIGYGTSYGSWGYDPYWSNSWVSGYGYNPYSPFGYGHPFGYYGYGNYGYGYGGYGMGYGPYQGPWGGCYGCYEPIGYQNLVYSHRPSVASGVAGSTVPGMPRMAVRNPASLLTPPQAAETPAFRQDREGTRRTDRITVPEAPTRQLERRPAQRPTRTFDLDHARPSRSTGGDFGGGGGRTVSPRPR